MGKHAAIFGGNWNNTSNSGSRCSNWNNAASNSNNNISSRFVCDDAFMALPMLRLGRQIKSSVISQFCPPSGKTMIGSA
jgi:hypothetical protein